MKILVINSYFPPYVVGGAEVTVHILVKEIKKVGVDVVVLARCYNTMKKSEEQFEGIRVYFIPLPKWRNFGLSKPIWHLWDTYNLHMKKLVENLIIQEKPNIIHTHNLSGFSVSVWDPPFKMKIPIIHTSHDFYLLCPKTTMFKNGKICKKQCLSCFLLSVKRKSQTKKVHAVTTPSQFLLKKHLEYQFFQDTPLKKVIFNPVKLRNKSVRNRYSQNLRLGFLGRIEKKKGIELLLETFSNIKDKVELYIAGKGNEKYIKKLKNKYSHKNIHWLGWISPEEFFEKIDLLVFPSVSEEAFGRGIIEAYSLGIPVIGSKIGGIPEIIEDGKTGFLFDYKRPQELLEIISFILKNPLTLEKLKKNVLAYSRKFSQESIARQYLEVYEDLLKLKEVRA